MEHTHTSDSDGGVKTARSWQTVRLGPLLSLLGNLVGLQVATILIHHLAGVTHTDQGIIRRNLVFMRVSWALT